ncbi:MAG TPA: DUF2905 domain-containing protein [Balneolales bacterium]|nr:DUF2905 domain-containing protein [Balneolales bacterium]
MIDQFQSTSGILIIIGIIILIVALIWPLFERIGFGRLPGDFIIERGNFRIYIPITTCVILSLFFTLIFWLVK